MEVTVSIPRHTSAIFEGSKIYINPYYHVQLLLPKRHIGNKYARKETEFFGLEITTQYK